MWVRASLGHRMVQPLRKQFSIFLMLKFAVSKIKDTLRGGTMGRDQGRVLSTPHSFHLHLKFIVHLRISGSVPLWMQRISTRPTNAFSTLFLIATTNSVNFCYHFLYNLWKIRKIEKVCRGAAHGTTVFFFFVFFFAIDDRHENDHGWNVILDKMLLSIKPMVSTVMLFLLH